MVIVTLLAGAARTEEPRISPSRISSQGWLVHDVVSDFQQDTTRIKVLLPEKQQPGQRFAVVYVLPVEKAAGERWGNGLLEVKKTDFHNRHAAIFVAPTFSYLPWYADHPTDPRIRQESYLLRVVVPFVDRTYPSSARRDSRLLVGFSKSGWGALALLLRNPETFGRAAAWDAPLMMDRPGMYGSGPIFGTKDNFSRYQMTRLIESRGRRLGGATRLIHLGHDAFASHHERFEALLERLEIPHVHRAGPRRPHVWGSDWLPAAADLLLADEEKNGRKRAKKSS